MRKIEKIFLDDSKMPQFLLIHDTDGNFEVQEVSSWSMDNEPSETELYMKGLIKWDGCSHVNFGDENGYIHLCGKTFWDNHAKLITIIWDKVTVYRSEFDKKIAS